LENRSVILPNVPGLGFVWCLLIDELKLCIFWQESHRNDVVPFSVSHIIAVMMSMCFITGGIDQNQLVKVASVGFLYFIVTIFSLIANKYLVAKA
jgi:hypothetical protein